MSAKRRADGPAVKTRPKQPVSARQRVLKVLKWLLIAGLVGALFLVAAFAYLYKTTDIPDPNKDFQTQTSFVYYADGKTSLGQYATQNRESISLKEMPQTIQDAVVAAENRSFWTDKGIDPKGILRAAFSNASGGATQGASTITQQYVKILYLSQERSYTRKLKEAILSLKMQRSQSKSQILEGYLNTIYFGRGAYGIQAASRAYFNTDAKNLTLSQSAVLASVLNNPTHFDPANGKASKQDLKERYDYVLDGMASAGNITADQATKAEKRLPKFPKIQAQSQYGGQKGHMLSLVKTELHALGFSDEDIDGGGLRVTTTFTPKAMDAAEQGVLEGKPDGFGDKELHIAVASVEPGTGALRGFYGGQDYLQSQINWSVAGGMVGSTFKPITLATALDNGYSLKDTFDGNSPYEFPDGLTVRNEGTGSDGQGNDYGSAVDATYALEQSINTAYVDMSNSIPDGPDKIAAMANAMGIPPTKATKKYPGIPSTSRDLDSDALITLGKARISAINMANAYATIANGGKRANVHVIDKVTRNGETLYDYKQSTTDAMSEDIAADTSYALQQVVQQGTGKAALALGRPAAGKTGTATNSKDEVSSAWFVGYTPQLATAVMYVRGDGDNQLDGWLPSYFGADYPAQTWTDVMKRDMEGLPVEEFPPPANVDGTAPDSGHDPYTPPPSPTRTAQPSRSPSQTPSETPSETPTETPSDTPSQSPTPTCTVLGGCDSPTPSDSSSPSSSPTSPQPSNPPASHGNHVSGTAAREPFWYAW
ncbi:membrane peptidoglycan carboxypeptidase [Nocardioides ginsengisegetis]|uniref:Membrane peptidoglycan carboxypeptidase n=1 Tax=Nocardioides ginsengisegetis TaxID=661491 RepID=A0A7W3PBC2_9ACTN|nr:transglycosylase domain-containing protein [Nocardioides ginsengisegetis]MBA8805680.1 membrane peptidoglycan carboxypeptidase [Nocardioides ginsengisegetis]